MRQLSDFINHGILPFVGRAAILEEIAAFRRKTVRRGQLELFLIEAPAGRGKSRLVEAITTQLDGDDSGIVLHLRFYPETPMHLSSELLRDVERVARRIGLTLDDERGAPGNLPQKLRRLVRLRPTLLIIEDLHLLPTDRRDGFLRFFEDFVDEPLPTLVLARPLDSELSGRIEPYRVRSIDLPGLDVDDVARLWQELFATKPKPAILAAIVETTTGNPLAIRSALRGGVEREEIALQQGIWRVIPSLDRFTASLRLGTQRLLEGMAAHLDEEERRAALLLSRLGEVFARETAELLLRSDDLIDRLIFKGVLRLGTAAPRSLTEKRSAFAPLHFVHTLLHEHCLAEEVDDINLLFATLRARLPHYSYRLFEHLLARVDRVELDRAQTEETIDNLCSTIVYARDHPEWERTLVIQTILERLVERSCRDIFDDEETRQFYRAQAEMMWLSLYSRRFYEEEFAARAEQLLTMTDDAESERIARIRLRALSYLARVQAARETPLDLRAIETLAEETIQAWPDLEIDAFHFQYIGLALHHAGEDNELRDRIVARHRALEERYTEMDRPAQISYRRSMVSMLLILDTPEDIITALDLLATLESDPDIIPKTLHVKREVLYLSSGRLIDLASCVDTALRAATSYGDQSGIRVIAIAREACRLMLHGGRVDVATDLTPWLAGFPKVPRLAPIQSWMLYAFFAPVFGLDTILADHPLPSDPTFLESLPPGTRIRLHRRNQRPMPPIALRHHLAPLLAHLVTSDAGERDQQDVQHLADDLRVFLATPLHRIDQISGVVAIAEWLGSLDARTRAALALDSTLTSTIDRVIDHLLAIPAPGLLRCFLEECDAEIPTTKKRTARKLMVEAEQRGRAIVADRLERRDESEGTEGTEEERQLSMIGEIAVTMPGAPERSPVRGAGIKRALGTLVADRMLDRPMDFAEIARLVGGDETTDAERGRKLVNNAVYKIRKLLGNDAIEADRGSVRLRDEVIAIDLLALDRSLKSATAAIDGGNIAPALDDLRHSLALFGQGPVWPGLYDPFFEAARSELEWRLRSTLLRGATALAEAGDPAGATHLLELGRTAMPGDEEIVEQLVAMLERQGKFVEAERLRMDNEAV